MLVVFFWVGMSDFTTWTPSSDTRAHCLPEQVLFLHLDKDPRVPALVQIIAIENAEAREQDVRMCGGKFHWSSRQECHV